MCMQANKVWGHFYVVSTCCRCQGSWQEQRQVYTQGRPNDTAE